MLSVLLSVAVVSCGNYGYPEGYKGDHPIFTRKPIVGAGVENIRVREITCRRGRRMVKAFWNDGFVCNGEGHAVYLRKLPLRQQAARRRAVAHAVLPQGRP